MLAYREHFGFTHVLMLHARVDAGDNIYEGPATARDYRLKFESPYGALLAEGVSFRAVLGNHDDPNQRFYGPFGMGGERYYTFELPEGVLSAVRPRARFFALDSTRLDLTQRRWLARELARSDGAWKICLMHHPLYTSGRYHRYARIYRWALESLFVANGVDVVFSGHEHLYERSTLQRGVQYFISSAGGALRAGDARPVPHVARTFDDDYHFMLVEITAKRLYFQAISRLGKTVDAGVIERAADPAPPIDATRPGTEVRQRSDPPGS
jgi:3',5'-cyclic AMP phosphodiesterase CpdA